jgi:type IV pilus assembly protein PilM
MFGFGFEKKSFLGIDVGTSAIKIVELRVDSGKPVLSNYAWMPIAIPFSREGSVLDKLDLTFPNLIKKMVREAGFKSKEAFISIPAFGGLITLIEFPQMKKEDMEQAIRFEAHKYIPTSLSEVVLSWDVVGLKSDTSKNESAMDDKGVPVKKEANLSSKLEILLVAASKSKVAKYENLVRSGELNLRSVELESFPMIRALVGNDQGIFVIVDIGSRICNIILVENGTIRINRNIDAGGKDVTSAIAKSIGVTEERAEAMKVSGKNFFAKDSSVNFPHLDMVISEISRIISNLKKDRPDIKIDGIILSGGTANLTGIDVYFSDSLGEKVLIGNPFSRVQYDHRLDPIIKKQGIQFTVSIGLALKGISNYLKK